jgi:hypothetical protein
MVVAAEGEEKAVEQVRRGNGLTIRYELDYGQENSVELLTPETEDWSMFDTWLAENRGRAASGA